MDEITYEELMMKNLPKSSIAYLLLLDKSSIKDRKFLINELATQARENNLLTQAEFDDIVTTLKSYNRKRPIHELLCMSEGMEKLWHRIKMQQIIFETDSEYRIKGVFFKHPSYQLFEQVDKLGRGNADALIEGIVDILKTANQLTEDEAEHIKNNFFCYSSTRYQYQEFASDPIFLKFLALIEDEYVILYHAPDRTYMSVPLESKDMEKKYDTVIDTLLTKGYNVKNSSESRNN